MVLAFREGKPFPNTLTGNVCPFCLIRYWLNRGNNSWECDTPERQSLLKSSLAIRDDLLDFWCCWCYHRVMKEKHRWPTTSIRANPEVIHQARVAAVTAKKALGQWLEEAIVEKIEREQGKQL